MRKQKSAPAKRATSRKKAAVREQPMPANQTESASSAVSVADSARQRMISEAAYYRSEKRGFAPGRELEDWLAAEIEISGHFLQQSPAAELH